MRRAQGAAPSLYATVASPKDAQLRRALRRRPRAQPFRPMSRSNVPTCTISYSRWLKPSQAKPQVRGVVPLVGWKLVWWAESLSFAKPGLVRLSGTIPSSRRSHSLFPPRPMVLPTVCLDLHFAYLLDALA